MTTQSQFGLISWIKILDRNYQCVPFDNFESATSGETLVDLQIEKLLVYSLVERKSLVKTFLYELERDPPVWVRLQASFRHL